MSQKDNENKRRMPRQRAKRRVTYRLDGRELRSITHDIGPGGLFIRSHRIPERGKAVTLEVEMDGAPNIWISGRVAFGRRQIGVPTHMQECGFGVALESAPEKWFSQFC